ncbi:apicoplast Ufd1, partial [Plasmodium falciparum IGH-CR14]
LLSYVNDLNNINLGNDKNEFYLITLPLCEKFNPFVGTFCHNNIQYSDKASLPIFIYDIYIIFFHFVLSSQLLNKHIEVPWNFVIEKVNVKTSENYKNVCMPNITHFNNYKNINNLNRVFINVLDFKAKKNFIFLPTWVMKSLNLNCFDVIRLRFVKLETASSVKILEEKLRYYSCITRNSTISIKHDDVVYYFDVIRIDSEKKKDTEVASIQDADVIFDFVKEKYNS